MPDRLYSRLATEKLLARAWHLARVDSLDDFVPDPWGNVDVARNLKETVQNLARLIRARSYRPKPLRYLDWPKSEFSARPGSVVPVEDKIVLWAVALLLAPKLDRSLAKSVYSFRVKGRPTQTEFFDRGRIYELPFLKRATILEKLAEFDQWFYSWSAYSRETLNAFRKEGYNYLAKSDIASYFENIDLSILRAELLRDLPDEQEVVNLLIEILESWSWPAISGIPSSRGIPQGNDISGFIGTFYLRRLDERILRLARRRGLYYARYVDDVTILAKSRTDGREALVTMATVLRGLRLNVQGAKTEIIEGQSRIEQALTDPLVAKVGAISSAISGQSRMTRVEADRVSRTLRHLVLRASGLSPQPSEHHERAFRLAVTIHRRLNHPGMVAAVLSMLLRNPDTRLLSVALLYFRSLHHVPPAVPGKLLGLAKSPELFPYHRAQLLSILRVIGHEVPGLRAFAHMELRTNSEWAVRQEAARLVGTLPLGLTELDRLAKRFGSEPDSGVRRAILAGLTQWDARRLRSFLPSVSRSPEPEVYRLAFYMTSLLNDPNEGFQIVRNLLNAKEEFVLIERHFDFELLAKSSNPEVRLRLLRGLLKRRKQVMRKVLRERFRRVIRDLIFDPELAITPSEKQRGPPAWVNVPAYTLNQ